MKPSDRQLVLRELGWVCEDPGVVIELLTEDEIKDIVRHRYVTKSIWQVVDERRLDPTKAGK